MRTLSLTLFTGLVVSATACGGSDSISLEDLPARIAAASCERIFRCCDATEQMQQFDNFDPPPTNQAECEATLTALYQNFIINDEALDAGRLGYDSAAAGECVAAADGAACGGAAGGVDSEACDRVFVGQVAIGGACEGDDECAGEASCEGDPGACEALPALGAPCIGPCVSGAYCDFATSVCTTLKSNGAACDSEFECQSDYCDDTTMQCATEPPSTTCDGN